MTPKRGCAAMEEQKVKTNLYLSSELDDSLEQFAERFKLSKNAITVFALTKLLMEMNVLQIDKEENKERNIIKSTDYCDILKQATHRNGDKAHKIERIFVKHKEQIEIRFAYYKQKKGKDYLIPRPLDVSEDELFEVMEEACKNGVFSSEFKNRLKLLL